MYNAEHKWNLGRVKKPKNRILVRGNLKYLELGCAASAVCAISKCYHPFILKQGMQIRCSKTSDVLPFDCGSSQCECGPSCCCMQYALGVWVALSLALDGHTRGWGPAALIASTTVNKGGRVVDWLWVKCQENGQARLLRWKRVPGECLLACLWELITPCGGYRVESSFCCSFPLPCHAMPRQRAMLEN